MLDSNDRIIELYYKRLPQDQIIFPLNKCECSKFKIRVKTVSERKLKSKGHIIHGEDNVYTIRDGIFHT